MKQIAPFLLILALLIVFAVVIIALLNYRLKNRILDLNLTDKDFLESLTGPGFKLEILKWGLILFFGGMGLVVLEFIPYSSDQSPLPYGLESIFVAIGFFIYYQIVKNKK